MSHYEAFSEYSKHLLTCIGQDTISIRRMWARIKLWLKQFPFLIKGTRSMRRAVRILRARLASILGRRPFHRDHFEKLFEQKEDPWNFRGSHQQERLRFLLESIPSNHGAILEVGCAEGIFTRMIGSTQRRIIAVDVSRTSLLRARQHCEFLSNIHFVQADLLHLPFLNSFHTIICAGVLVYLTKREHFKKTADRLIDLLPQGGYLVLEHLWESTGAELNGSYIHSHFLQEARLKQRNFLRHDEYAISVFERS